MPYDGGLSFLLCLELQANHAIFLFLCIGKVNTNNENFKDKMLT